MSATYRSLTKASKILVFLVSTIEEVALIINMFAERTALSFWASIVPDHYHCCRHEIRF